jgi:hypothetical protein
LSLSTQRFAYAVAIDCAGYVPEHNHVSVPPGATRHVRLQAVRAGAAECAGSVTALNGAGPIEVMLEACSDLD